MSDLYDLDPDERRHRDLVKRLEALERALTPPEPPDVNALLRDEWDRARGKNDDVLSRLVNSDKTRNGKDEA